jgi:hypothetical protein
MKRNNRSKPVSHIAAALLLLTVLFWLTACGTAGEISPTVQVVPPTQIETPSPTEAQPAPVEAELVPTSNGLSPTGPWILLSTENGLWTMDEDGSGLAQLTQEAILAPSDLKATTSNSNPHVAYITASDPTNLQGLSLNILTLPEGKVETITPLTSPENEPQPNHEMCDPKYEAARAVTIGNSMAWSPDGSQLAFIGSLQGDNADVYVYSLAEKSITRLSKETGQAYDLHWAPGGQNVVYFSATCFGTGAGFQIEAAWAVRPNDARVIQLYKPDAESWGEAFVGWDFNEREGFFVASTSGCPYKNLRMIDIESQAVTPIYKDCFNDFATGPTDLLAVLTSSDFSDKPGLYHFIEPLIPDIPPTYVPEPNGREVRLGGNYFLYSVLGDQGPEIHSVDLFHGQPGEYLGKGDFPVFSSGGELWAWNEGGNFYLGGKEMSKPIPLSTSPASYPFWDEDVTQDGNIYERLFFFRTGDHPGLYMASSPDFQPTLLLENAKPVSTPVLVWPRIAQ